ncbi:MAG: hypothetical protein K2K09_06810, partial [Lachnospiraceae bacterium]|nr:hypothetical protein [Lachnospiraceae bacterium]
EEVMAEYKTGVHNIRQDISIKQSQDRHQFQLFEEMLKKLESRAKTYYEGVVAGIDLLQRIQYQIESGVQEQSSDIRKEIQSVQKNLKSEFQKISERMGVLIQNDERIASNLKRQGESIQKAVSKGTEEVTSGNRELSVHLENLEKNEETALRNLSEQFELAINEFKDTRKHYEKVVHLEDEWLDRLENLSNDFLVLKKAQTEVMEHLSQLCQDSDQFMEIQKSINDMWEIMKVVWVDSLLDEFSKL